MRRNIGVLALQGAFSEHISMLSGLGAHCVEIRQKSDLTDTPLDGIVLPGGESTVMGKLLCELGLFSPSQQAITNGLPVLGTCAGLILLAKKILNASNVYFGAMDIEVKRNAYGRQLGSFYTTGDFAGIGEIPMTFIRAPYIVRVSAKANVLAVVENHIVAAKQNKMIVTSFHPELTSDTKVHSFFLQNL